MLTFTPITLEHHALLRKYYAGCDYHLCEYSAGTKLMWSLYLRPSFAEEAGCLIVRNRIDGEWVFDYPVPGPDGDVDAALTAIESYCTDTETPLVISVVPEEKAPELLLRWPRLRMNNVRHIARHPNVPPLTECQTAQPAERAKPAKPETEVAP